MENYGLVREFAEAIVKSHLHTSEQSCHNDRWLETACSHCGASNYSGPLTHKSDCVVLKAQEYLKIINGLYEI
jgi:hypothetical protein